MHKLVRQMNSISNPTTCVVYFLLDSILGGYITEFVVDCIQSCNVEKGEFFKGPHGRFLKSLITWIKILLCDKHMMIMEFA
jgi:hypothetical protein